MPKKNDDTKKKKTMIANTKMMTVKEQNKALSQTSVSGIPRKTFYL